MSNKEHCSYLAGGSYSCSVERTPMPIIEHLGNLSCNNIMPENKLATCKEKPKTTETFNIQQAFNIVKPQLANKDVCKPYSNIKPDKYCSSKYFGNSPGYNLLSSDEEKKKADCACKDDTSYGSIAIYNLNRYTANNK